MFREEKQLSSPLLSSPHGRATPQPILVWLSPPSHPVLHSNKDIASKIKVLQAVVRNGNMVNISSYQELLDYSTDIGLDGVLLSESRVSLLQLSIRQSRFIFWPIASLLVDVICLHL